MLDFSLRGFIEYQQRVGTSCVMAHEEKRLAALQKTAVITVDQNNLITSYEEKPRVPKGNLAVPPFYIYRFEDIWRIQEELDDARQELEEGQQALKEELEEAEAEILEGEEQLEEGRKQLEDGEAALNQQEQEASWQLSRPAPFRTISTLPT